MIAATLLTDGSSDRVLIPILRWLCGEWTTEAVEIRWADLTYLPRPPRTLTERARVAVELHPCDLLFVHRDAEREPAEHRHQEVAEAVGSVVPWVAVVPVRMQEAWLLHEEQALREAAGRPAGREPLNLPPTQRVESLPDPKAVLHEALKKASGTRGRRAQAFSPVRAAHRLADSIRDWSALRTLSAFQRLEADTRAALQALRIRSDG